MMAQTHILTRSESGKSGQLVPDSGNNTNPNCNICKKCLQSSRFFANQDPLNAC